MGSQAAKTAAQAARDGCVRAHPSGVIQQAQADLDVVGPRIATRLTLGRAMRATPLLDDLVGPVKPALQAL
jgi:hypothetical protein